MFTFFFKTPLSVTSHFLNPPRRFSLFFVCLGRSFSLSIHDHRHVFFFLSNYVLVQSSRYTAHFFLAHSHPKWKRMLFSFPLMAKQLRVVCRGRRKKKIIMGEKLPMETKER